MIKLREHEIAELMKRYKVYRRHHNIVDSCKLVSKELDIPWETVYGVQRRLRPTVGLAEDYLRANAFKLATRVVRKANVDQAMNILSRPNVGVLHPAAGAGEGGGSRFMIGVSIDSLGAVKVAGAVEHAALPPVQDEETIEVQDAEEAEALPVA